MKTKIALALLALGATPFANANIFEYNDPTSGNIPSSCSITATYSTGGSWGIYTAYTVSCPGHTIKLGIEAFNTFRGTRSCKFTTYTSGYSTSGNCNNWRIQ